MDELNIYWTATAKKQRDEVFEYWNERNGSNRYSQKLNHSIGIKLNRLKNHPEIGHKTNFKNTRAISLKHYSILYQIKNPKIIITGFWDNRRDPKKLLKWLKEK